MNLLRTLTMALNALSVNKGRTGLTSLGITIGIAAVIAMVAAGHGAKSKIDSTFGSIGPNLVVGFSGKTSSSGLKLGIGEGAYTREDAEEIRRQLAPLINGCTEVTQFPTVVSNKNGSHHTFFAGGVEDVFRIRRWGLQAGRFYNNSDVKRQSNVAVIGDTVKKNLFANIEAKFIVGQRVRAGNQQFKVIGVLAPKGATPAGDQDDIILVPISTLMRKVMGTNKCLLLLVEARSTELVPKVKAEMEKILRHRYRLKEDEEADFRIQSMKEYADIVNIIANTLNGLIFMIASISLVVGGIGIMNIMLVSVTERTREIGIRMAVGAKTRDILGQFLAESAVLAIIGGAVGIVLGGTCAWGIAYYVQWEFVITPVSVLVAVFTSAAVGIFFGYYPARKASLLDPIEALRYE